MIAGDHSRFLLATPTPGATVRYDRLFRRTTSVAVPVGAVVDEGRDGHFRVTRFIDGCIECDVRTVDAPDEVLASGRFDDGSWTFQGEAKRWESVDQYLLENGDQPTVLRIADDSVPVEIESDRLLTSVREVPGSRLAMCLAEGSVLVFDPHTGRVGENLETSTGHPPRFARFRPGAEELWLDSADTLIALDTRHWQVRDAAGWEGDQSIAFWNFVDSATALVGDGVRSVMLLDLDTMLPGALAEFSHTPVDAMVVGKHVHAVDASGNFEKAKLRPL